MPVYFGFYRGGERERGGSWVKPKSRTRQETFWSAAARNRRATEHPLSNIDHNLSAPAVCAFLHTRRRTIRHAPSYFSKLTNEFYSRSSGIQICFSNPRSSDHNSTRLFAKLLYARRVLRPPYITEDFRTQLSFTRLVDELAAAAVRSGVTRVNNRFVAFFLSRTRTAPFAHVVCLPVKM